jgi:hypothetical protein
MDQPYFDPVGKPAVVGYCEPAEVVVMDDEEVGAIRVENFFTEPAALALYRHLSERIVYERDDIGTTKRSSRGARAGEMPDDPLVCSTDGPVDSMAEAALGVFSDPWLIRCLEPWLACSLRVLRPPTPYRLAAGDFIDPHDDCAAPEYQLSIACNLTRESSEDSGGETIVGLVDHVEEYDDPGFFFPLKKWTLKPGERVLQPLFNSILLLPLSECRAHAVRLVQDKSRYSITTLYGDRVA